MVRYLFYTIGDLTYQSPLVSFQFDANCSKEMIYCRIYEDTLCKKWRFVVP